MCGGHASADGVVDLIHQEIISNDDIEFDDPDELEDYLGRQYFEISLDDKLEFTSFANTVLMKENLETKLPEKITVKIKSKI